MSAGLISLLETNLTQIPPNLLLECLCLASKVLTSVYHKAKEMIPSIHCLDPVVTLCHIKDILLDLKRSPSTQYLATLFLTIQATLNLNKKILLPQGEIK
ncbi:hypothetical protein DSO57_1020685 [Entomophthora muscae]|uniref:Uncharacterized protein n=1 Tax=Entomophthora muscae TaxID=34485 RepID=A0ACC2U1N8_9FUNG|nr:hypothetical protein DSO57_1020685 [Entomophthora muscae]